ncbi:hypothetical protein CICLE_v10017626mg [Citrus x clementina]|uniref:Uncharacterized protein n=1 Tax=Citrus clementina TaxID=85681 RepID=V4TKC1_CITCL|nr:hypothetical protein CICLE_v10017626mg [Citrus x clementina]
MKAIVRKTRHLFERRYAAWLPWKGKLPLVVREKVNNAIEAAREMNVETTEGHLSGIPCAHASKCILNVGREVDDFVDPLLIKDRYLSTYALMMQLLPEEKCWPNSNEFCCSKVKEVSVDLLEEGEVSAPTSVFCCSNIKGSSEDYSTRSY